MKRYFKKESFIMTSVVLCYAILAGGSLSKSDMPLLIFLGIFVALIIIMAVIQSIIKDNNKKKRLNLTLDFEKKNTDFNLSDKIGDDRCVVYFDKAHESALIASITTEGVVNYSVDGFSKDVVAFSTGDFCAIDATQRKALLIKDHAKYRNFEVVDYTEKDLNQEIVSSNTFTPILEVFRMPIDIDVFATLFVLVEESYGYITLFTTYYYDSFNYVAKDSIPFKNKSSVIIKAIGAYIFVIDDFFKILTIIFPNRSNMIVSYNDIISVSYEEDGNILFSKSTGRTVGGAIVGGALLGGAGAVVGGLSGNTSQNKKVQNMSIKILVRNTKNPTIGLKINLKDEKFNTKDSASKINYDTRLEWANQIKDLISVLIDNSNQHTNDKYFKSEVNKEIVDSKKEMSIADELAKLAKLKETGVINNEEFNTLKSKLLDS